MSEMLTIVLYCWLSGLAIFVGALLASRLPANRGEIEREVLHGIVAFGGGILIAAVSFVLAPKGLAGVSLPAAAFWFCSGAVLFMIVDRKLAQHGGSKAQLMAMLLDYIPEAIALGAVFPHDHQLGILLSLFIGLQNLPEGFNAFREATGQRHPRGKTLKTMLLLSLLGPAAGLTGWLLLAGQNGCVAALMLVSAGGILYLIFQDIAPQVRMKRHWSPPLGATLGFLLGMIGEKLLG